MARLFGKGKDEPSGSGSAGSHFAGSKGRSRNGDDAVLPEDFEVQDREPVGVRSHSSADSVDWGEAPVRSTAPPPPPPPPPARTRPLRVNRSPEVEEPAELRAPAEAPAPSTAGRPLLGEILVEQGLVEPEALDEALEKGRTSGLRLGEALLRGGFLDERQLSQALAGQYGVEWFDLSQTTPDPAVAARLAEDKARDLNALPIRDVDGVIEVIVGNLRPGLDGDIRALVGAPIRLLAVPPSVARQAIDRSFRALDDVDRLVQAFTLTEGPRQTGTRAREEAESADSPVANLVSKIVTQGLRDRASDIHIEPSDGTVRVRYRIDGALTDVTELPESMAAPLVSRIKILSGMNIVERRKAQDGQFGMRIDDRDIDVRVSTMATVFGEKCVMRILDKSRSLIRLGDLGMPKDTHAEFSKMVRSPFGMVLCAGPTGSGKTTTLYATMAEIDERSRNVVTIEDPVEYVFPSINQIQTNEQAGITFADGLRAILRQDPDIILVGEIRDQETARIATQAALTGHFVMSSLHATDSVAALHRFLDMGIEAFLVASSVLGIVSQRLVRRICKSCAAPYQPTDEEMAFYV